MRASERVSERMNVRVRVRVRVSVATYLNPKPESETPNLNSKLNISV